MAGESAREVARRRREKAERLARQADLWERGAAGEEATAALLDSLRAEGWHSWHDVAWPGRPRANLDHVLIGPGGVFVVDSKHWSGSITVNDNVLRQNGRRRETAVTGAAEAALVITRVMGDLPATGVLCFVRDEPITGWARDVMLCSSETVIEMLKSRPSVIHPSAVGRYARQLDRALSPAGERPAPSRAGGRPRTSVEPRGPVERSPLKRPAQPNPWRPLIGMALMLVLVLFAWSMTSAGGDKSTGQPGGRSHDLGDTVAFQKQDERPRIEVAVTKVKRTIAKGEPASLAPGHRIVAVYLTITNTGKSVWLPERSVHVRLDTDPTGTLSPDHTPGRVQAGRLLASKPIIKPGETQRRVVVFEVPKGSTVEGVRVQLDPLYDDEIRWIL